jgi:hypothetical protein
VKNYTFNFEVQTLLEQFVAAFGNIVIKRYDNTKTVQSPTSGIPISFVYAPKQRVYDVLNTPAPGGITVPAVAVSLGSIQRDNTRVSNKITGFTVPFVDTNGGNHSFSNQILQPVPVNIGVNMHIVTKFQADMDQILSNFIPYCDPYIVISWKLPFANNYELRSEVLWSGQVNLTYPDNLAANAPFRLVADTSFTIKGWLFKDQQNPVGNIYTINENLIVSDDPAVNSIILSTI